MDDLPISNDVKGLDSSEVVMNIVIKSIRGIYPAFRAAVKNQQELDNLKKEWLIGFVENNIKTDIQINRGLKRARLDRNSFIPSVGQFVEWCKSPDRSFVEFSGNLLENQGNKLSPEEVRDLLIKNKKRMGL